MVESIIEKITRGQLPPTKELIQQETQKQLDAIKALRRQLMEVIRAN